jgi:hypothetical protein
MEEGDGKPSVEDWAALKKVASDNVQPSESIEAPDLDDDAAIHLVEQVILSSDLTSDLYSCPDAHRINGWRSDAVDSVKHLKPADLFSLEAFAGPARISLGGFVNRFNAPNQTWMREQKYYLERAVLAAAYECMIPLVTGIPGELPARLTIDDYDAIRFLKCGRASKYKGGVAFFSCGDVNRCPPCNKNMRVLPVIREFLPGFIKHPHSYSIGIGTTNDPKTAGVHLEIGKDQAGAPIYEHLFLLRDAGEFERLPRFGIGNVDACLTVSKTVFDFAHWLTHKRNKLFGGIGLLGDIDFTFVPDPSAPLGCSHSVLVHSHGFGNTPRLLTKDDAAVMYDQCLKMLIKEGGGHLVGYPDIYLKLCSTADELRQAINYCVKPFKLPHAYIEGLGRGCPVEGLNWEFHQSVWTCEQIFIGANKRLVCYGNMHVNSPDYKFERQYRLMTANQVEDFLERLQRGDVSRQDFRRYEQHLLAGEQLRRYKLERQRQELAGILPEGTALEAISNAIYEQED